MIRIISRNANDNFDEAFFERRIKYAWDYRKTVMGEDINRCRIIFGEADEFPGLTIDRFNEMSVKFNDYFNSTQQLVRAYNEASRNVVAWRELSLN